jgi:hypothetical protein
MSTEDLVVAILLAALFAAAFAVIFDAASVIAVWAVRLAARWWHSDLDTSEELAQEWEALIKARPVGLLKLCTGLGLLARATIRQGRFVLRTRVPTISVGRLLRVLAGVDEHLLDKVPFERARYTRLGSIILYSALLSSVSMAVALQLTGVHQLWVIVGVCPFWLFMIATIDRFLVSSTYGPGIGKIARVLPRLMLALVFGVVIAEPLVLWVFRPAIEHQITQDRAARLATFESTLLQCNPVAPDGTRAASAVPSYCGQYVLALPQANLKTYSDERNREIQQLTASQRQQAASSVGLLERMSTLDELTKANSTALTATWMLRLLLYMIQCLPVLASLLNGTSAYDRLVLERIRTLE